MKARGHPATVASIGVCGVGLPSPDGGAVCGWRAPGFHRRVVGEKVATRLKIGAKLVDMVDRKEGRKTRSRAGRGGRVLQRHFSVKDAAALLGMPPSTLRGYLAQGLVERVKLPGLRGKVLLSETALIDFLDRHREPATAEITEELRRAEMELPRGAKRSARRRGGNGSGKEGGTK